jgi:transposase-like protein
MHCAWLVGFTDGQRESSQSWRDLLLDLKRRGLTTAAQIAVADGALGFWKALGEVWPTTLVIGAAPTGVDRAPRWPRER